MKHKFIPPTVTVEELTKALYETNIQLDQANKQLIRYSNEQAELFTNLSHDLRSPISALLGSIEYLLTLEDWNIQETDDILHMMQKKANFLNSLINDIFLLSSMDAQDKQLHLEIVNAGMFFEEFFYSCLTDKKYEQRELISQIPDEFPYDITIDTKLIIRVLDNLFSNALKYSNPGDQIICRLTKLDDSSLQLDVIDTGIGIAEETRQHIFERTYMGSIARTPSENTGCGLGLSIAQSIIKRHGGEIWCQSEYEKGSCFSFTLPISKT